MLWLSGKMFVVYCPHYSLRRFLTRLNDSSGLNLPSKPKRGGCHSLHIFNLFDLIFLLVLPLLSINYLL